MLGHYITKLVVRITEYLNLLLQFMYFKQSLTSSNQNISWKKVYTSKFQDKPIIKLRNCFVIC